MRTLDCSTGKGAIVSRPPGPSPSSGPSRLLRESVRRAHRIVVKLGSSVLVDEHGRVSDRRISTLVQAIAAWTRDGRECVIVSSGAVAAGVGLLAERPGPAPSRPTCAAIGQSLITSTFQRAFVASKLRLGQVLVDPTTPWSSHKETVEELLAAGIVPLINENDALTQMPAPSSFDNDQLAADLAESLDIDALILLTNVEGVFDRHPAEVPEARLLESLDPDDPQFDMVSAASGTPEVSELSRGGMGSKLHAARRASAAGCTVVIADGTSPGALSHILGGEPLGTVVPAKSAPRRKS